MMVKKPKGFYLGVLASIVLGLCTCSVASSEQLAKLLVREEPGTTPEKFVFEVKIEQVLGRGWVYVAEAHYRSESNAEKELKKSGKLSLADVQQLQKLVDDSDAWSLDGDELGHSNDGKYYEIYLVAQNMHEHRGRFHEFGGNRPGYLFLNRLRRTKLWSIRDSMLGLLRSRV